MSLFSHGRPPGSFAGSFATCCIQIFRMYIFTWIPSAFRNKHLRNPKKNDFSFEIWHSHSIPRSFPVGMRYVQIMRTRCGIRAERALYAACTTAAGGTPRSDSVTGILRPADSIVLPAYPLLHLDVFPLLNLVGLQEPRVFLWKLILNKNISCFWKDSLVGKTAPFWRNAGFVNACYQGIFKHMFSSYRH